MLRRGATGRPGAGLARPCGCLIRWRSQAAAIIAYRAKNGAFKTVDDLKQVPTLDAAKIDAKKDRITF